MNPTDFAPLFQRLTAEPASSGYPPFRWQERLYARLLAGDIPPLCDIPTGLGKTSVLALWLLALAEQASRPGTPLTLPRRLVYVVNRRVVVDQATNDAQRLFDNLHAAKDGPLLAVADSLRSLAVLPADRPGELRPPFALSTLRGQFADNRAWSADPCRPAIIVGTVDMIGSRLLFSAYRAGYKTKPLYAAFLGQDALVVHDEAHLEPAFQKLLVDLAREQSRSADAKPLQVMQLSATIRGIRPANGFALEPDEAEEPGVAKRLRAVKRLRLHALSDPKQLPEKLAELAFRHHGSDRAVLVFARNVDTVEKTADLLRKQVGKDQVQTLTGTMRGQERDALVDDKVFRRFLRPPTGGWPEPPRPGTVYLVCTSAGEVGVNLSADHLVCDLTTFESIAQRFGRVNRFGEREDTEVDVVHPAAFKDSEDEAPLAKTLALLEHLDGDVSPAALRSLDAQARAEAFNPLPAMLETSGILFDAWALTSITDPLPGRPPVEPYLHGVPENELPTTQVAWRDEVEFLTDHEGNLRANLGDQDLETLLEDYPLKPQEILQDRSYRVAEILVKLARKKTENLARPVWLQDNRGEVSRFTLGSLLDKRNKDRLDHSLLLLPPGLGGLSASGMLDPGSDSADDVADAWLDETGQPRRQRLWTADHDQPPGMKKMRLIRCIDTRPDATDEPDEETASVARRFWWWYEAPAGADSEGSSYARMAVALPVHTGDVQELARQFAAKLDLPAAWAEAVRLAGKFHDYGKDRRDWQQSIGNFGSPALAKSDGRKSARTVPTDYRHEFGSLLDLLAAPEFRSLSAETQDLTLHLIAAHHGRARPHFDPDETFDREHSKPQSDALAAETPRRFARLQRRHGRWGLAFLESLLRAADYAASANPSAIVGDSQP